MITIKHFTAKYFTNFYWKIKFDATKGQLVCQDLSVHLMLRGESVCDSF